MVAVMATAVAVLLALEVALLQAVRARRRIPASHSAALAETGRRTALLAAFVMLLAAVILIALFRLIAQSH
jgi:hypothetical protein